MRVYTDDDLYYVTDTGITIAFDRILRVGRIPYTASQTPRDIFHTVELKRTIRYAPRPWMHQNNTR